MEEVPLEAAFVGYTAAVHGRRVTQASPGATDDADRVAQNESSV